MIRGKEKQNRLPIVVHGQNGPPELLGSFDIPNAKAITVAKCVTEECDKWGIGSEEEEAKVSSGRDGGSVIEETEAGVEEDEGREGDGGAFTDDREGRGGESVEGGIDAEATEGGIIGEPRGGGGGGGARRRAGGGGRGGEGRGEGEGGGRVEGDLGGDGQDQGEIGGSRKRKGDEDIDPLEPPRKKRKPVATIWDTCAANSG